MQGKSQSRSSSVSLTVEIALESFDFLNTSDLEEELAEDGAKPIVTDRSDFQLSQWQKHIAYKNGISINGIFSINTM